MPVDIDTREETHPAMPIGKTIVFLGIPTVVLYLSTQYVVPLLIVGTGMSANLARFLVEGFVVYLPLIVTAVALARRDIQSNELPPLLTRLHLRRLTHRDWIWALLALFLVIFACGIHWYSLWWSTGGQGTTGRALLPPFLPIEASTRIPYWILIPWVPFFVLNVLGEELFWRGYVLPRQEAAFGWWAWFVNGSFWAIFHLPLGWNLWLVWLPLMYIVPFVVQRRQNVWIGIILHGIVNAAGFISIVLSAN